MIGNFPAVLNFNQFFLKLNWFIRNELPVLPYHWPKLSMNLVISVSVVHRLGGF